MDVELIVSPIIHHTITMFHSKCYDCGYEFYAPEGTHCLECGSDQLQDAPARDIIVQINAETGEGEIC